MFQRKSSALLTLITAVALAALVSQPLAAAGKDPLAQYWTATGTAYPAGKNFVKPLVWAPGQYTVTGTKIKGKMDSVTRTLLVGKENGGWIIETTETDKKGKVSVSQMLMYGYDEAMKNGDMSGFRIGWMKMREDGGELQVIEGEQIQFFNMFTKSTFEKLVINISTFVDGGAITVPAGTFSATNVQHASVKVLGMTMETDTWYHAAVPVNGLVKTQSSDGKTVTELLSFGFDGKPNL